MLDRDDAQPPLGAEGKGGLSPFGQPAVLAGADQGSIGDCPHFPIVEAIAALPCEVQLPDGWAVGALEQGLFASGPEERRGFLRRALRTCAALEHRQTFPSLGRARAWHRVYVVNVSRSGLLLLHSEQLFPKERLVVVLPDGKDVLIEISRCRRIQDRCFEVGGRFVSS
jgi:hypothetical protein